MEKDNRKYRICFIDYMWYVADPVFAIVLFHTVISIQRNQPI